MAQYNTGLFILDLDKIGFTLQGDAALNTVPLQVSWKQAFDENAGRPLQQVSVTGNVSGDQWSKLGVDMLVDRGMLKRTDFRRASEIVAEEIWVRLTMRDYPPPEPPTSSAA